MFNNGLIANDWLIGMKQETLVIGMKNILSSSFQLPITNYQLPFTQYQLLI